MFSSVRFFLVIRGGRLFDVRGDAESMESLWTILICAAFEFRVSGSILIRSQAVQRGIAVAVSRVRIRSGIKRKLAGIRMARFRCLVGVSPSLVLASGFAPPRG